MTMKASISTQVKTGCRMQSDASHCMRLSSSSPLLGLHSVGRAGRRRYDDLLARFHAVGDGDEIAHFRPELDHALLEVPVDDGEQGVVVAMTHESLGRHDGQRRRAYRELRRHEHAR